MFEVVSAPSVKGIDASKMVHINIGIIFFFIINFPYLLLFLFLVFYINYLTI